MRPEHLRLTDATRPGPRLAATVTLVEALGHEQLVHAVTVGEVPIVVRRPLVGGALAPLKLAVGTSVQFAIDPLDVHLFDVTSTERLDA